MPLRKLQTNFSSGEVSPDLEGRVDLPVFQNGVAQIRNLRPLPSGGLRRRGGLAYCTEIPHKTYQHNEWIFNSEQTYQLLLSDECLDIHDGVSGLHLFNDSSCAWTQVMLTRLSLYCQGDYAFVCHPDMPIQQIRRTGASTFVVENYAFDRTTSGSEIPVWQPYHRFARNDFPIKVTNLVGYTTSAGWLPGNQATLTTTAAYFVPGHVGVYLTIGDGQWEIYQVNNDHEVLAVLRSAHCRLSLSENALTINAGTTNVKVYDPFHTFVIGNTVTMINAVAFGMGSYDDLNGAETVTFADDNNWFYNYAPSGTVLSASVIGGGPSMKYHSAEMSTVDWKEQMYSSVRGWPHCVGGYQSRLIFGGGRDTPNRLNFSRLEAPFNFDVGTGADDDSIQVGISGRRTPTIQSVIGAEHPQIFTSEGEYYIPKVEDKAGLTPSTMSVLPQTFYGSKRGITPVEFDGATLFVSRNGAHLRQLVWGEQGYSAPDLSFVAHHLIDEPRWLAVQMEDSDQAAATALVLNTNGDCAVLTMMKSEKIAAWSLNTTIGDFHTACAVNANAFFVCRRTINGVIRSFLERLDRSHLLDGSLKGTYVGKVSGEANYRWGGFLIYANSDVQVVVDGRSDIGLYPVDELGRITIPVVASTVEVGFGFLTRVITLPPELALPDGPSRGEPRRVVSTMVDVRDTLGLKVHNTLVLNTKAHADMGKADQLMSGRFHVQHFGWNNSGSITISQPSNAPLTLLSISSELEF